MNFTELDCPWLPLSSGNALVGCDIRVLFNNRRAHRITRMR